MGRWTRQEHEHQLLVKIRRLFDTAILSSSNDPNVDARFSSFVRNLDTEDKAVQACFDSLVQRVTTGRRPSDEAWTTFRSILQAPVSPPDTSEEDDTSRLGVETTVELPIIYNEPGRIDRSASEPSPEVFTIGDRTFSAASALARQNLTDVAHVDTPPESPRPPSIPPPPPVDVQPNDSVRPSSPLLIQPASPWSSLSLRPASPPNDTPSPPPRPRLERYTTVPRATTSRALPLANPRHGRLQTRRASPPIPSPHDTIIAGDPSSNDFVTSLSPEWQAYYASIRPPIASTSDVALPNMPAFMTDLEARRSAPDYVSSLHSGIPHNSPYVPDMALSVSDSTRRPLLGRRQRGLMDEGHDQEEDGPPRNRRRLGSVPSLRRVRSSWRNLDERSQLQRDADESAINLDPPRDTRRDGIVFDPFSASLPSSSLLDTSFEDLRNDHAAYSDLTDMRDVLHPDVIETVEQGQRRLADDVEGLVSEGAGGSNRSATDTSNRPGMMAHDEVEPGAFHTVFAWPSGEDADGTTSNDSLQVVEGRESLLSRALGLQPQSEEANGNPIVTDGLRLPPPRAHTRRSRFSRFRPDGTTPSLYYENLDRQLDLPAPMSQTRDLDLFRPIDLLDPQHPVNIPTDAYIDGPVNAPVPSDPPTPPPIGPV